jgi:hypothetical protein
VRIPRLCYENYRFVSSDVSMAADDSTPGPRKTRGVNYGVSGWGRGDVCRVHCSSGASVRVEADESLTWCDVAGIGRACKGTKGDKSTHHRYQTRIVGQSLDAVYSFLFGPIASVSA